MRRFAAFLGPSLAPQFRPSSARMTVLPPARRGDVLDAAERYDALLFVDGVFDQDLSPTPKEVFAATARCRLFGAASMGALRAVECRRYGATPLGAIARWFERGVVDGDDELAVLYDPGNDRALTVPLINIRYLLALARRRALLDERTADAVLAHARSVYYAERTWHAALEPLGEASPVWELVPYADLKAMDARFAIRSVERLLA